MSDAYSYLIDKGIGVVLPDHSCDIVYQASIDTLAVNGIQAYARQADRPDSRSVEFTVATGYRGLEQSLVVVTVGPAVEGVNDTVRPGDAGKTCLEIRGKVLGGIIDRPRRSQRVAKDFLALMWARVQAAPTMANADASIEN